MLTRDIFAFCYSHNKDYERFFALSMSLLISHCCATRGHATCRCCATQRCYAPICDADMPQLMARDAALRCYVYSAAAFAALRDKAMLIISLRHCLRFCRCHAADAADTFFTIAICRAMLLPRYRCLRLLIICLLPLMMRRLMMLIRHDICRRRAMTLTPLRHAVYATAFRARY